MITVIIVLIKEADEEVYSYGVCVWSRGFMPKKNM